MRHILPLILLCTALLQLNAQNVDVTVQSQNVALLDTTAVVLDPAQMQVGSYPSVTETYQIPSFDLYDHYWDVQHLRSRLLQIPFANDRLMLILVQSANNPFEVPCVFDEVVLPYGPTKKGAFHSGVDLKVEPQTLVKSCFDGVVRMARPYGDYGLLVTIRHYNGLETVYAHLDKVCVKPGQIVNAGDVIGQTGKSGNVSDYLLHFETRFMNECVDPEMMIDFDNETLVRNTLVLSSADLNIVPLEDVDTKLPAPKPQSAAKPPVTPKQPVAPKPVETAKETATPSVSEEEEQENVQLQRAFDGEEEYHIVQKGETLYRISLKYGTTMQEILRLNNIQNADHIVEGQRLRVR